MRAVVLSIALASGVATFAAAPSGTARADGYYCGGLVPAHGWCHTANWKEGVYRNRAAYPGGGTVKVAICMYRSFTGTWHHCYEANNFVAYNWGYCINGYPYVGNKSGNRHTVEGHYRNIPGCVNTALPEPESAVSPRQVAELGDGALEVLRAPGAVPKLTPATRLAVDETEEFLIDLAGARLAMVGDDGASYIVAPGERTCLFRQTADGTLTTCSTPEQIAAGEAVVVGQDSPDKAVRITGLAPDGAVLARAQLASGGPAVELPITNNVFAGEMAAAIEGASPRVVFILRDEAEEEGAGGCATGGTGGGIAGGLLLALGLLFARRRRR